MVSGKPLNDSLQKGHLDHLNKNVVIGNKKISSLLASEK